MAELYRYSGADLVVVALGVQLDCLAEDDAVKVEWDDDAGEIISSASGECGIHMVNASEKGTITVRSLIGSPSTSPLLSKALQGRKGGGYGSVQVIHTESGASFNLEKAFLANPQNISFGKNNSYREWIFKGLQLKMVGGGYLSVG